MSGQNQQGSSFNVSVTDLGALIVGVIIPSLSWLREDKQFALVFTFVGVVAICLYIIIRQEKSKSDDRDRRIATLEAEVVKCEMERAQDIRRAEERITALNANQNNLWRDLVIASGDRAIGTWADDLALGIQRYIVAPPSVPPAQERRGRARARKS